MSWTDTYRPTSLADIVGHDKQISSLREWADSWSEHHEPVVLHGPPGVGKTSSAHALANDMNYSVMEMDASDKRTGDVVDKFMGEASKTHSLYQKNGKLLIIDEVDNLHGHSDRGGKSAITRLVKDAEQPIILIANDFYDLSRGLRNNTRDIEFDYVDTNIIAQKLASICDMENVGYDVAALRKIAAIADGDLRAAITELHKASMGNDTITTEDVLSNSNRDQKEEIFPFLDALFKEDPPDVVHGKAQSLDMTPNNLFRWVAENIDRGYSDPEELAKGYESLSNADIWLGRTYQTQNYKFWRYVNDNLTAGIASARDGGHGGWTRWQPPRYRTRNTYSSDLLSKMSEQSGYSTQTVRTELIPYIKQMVPYCKPKQLTTEIAAWYDMDAEEVASITGSGKTTNKVQGIVEDAKEMQSDFEIQQPEELNSFDDTTSKDTTDENTTSKDKSDETDEMRSDAENQSESSDNTEDNTEESENVDADNSSENVDLTDFM